MYESGTTKAKVQSMSTSGINWANKCRQELPIDQRKTIFCEVFVTPVTKDKYVDTRIQQTNQSGKLT